MPALGSWKDYEQADGENSTVWSCVFLGGSRKMHFLLHKVFVVTSTSPIAATLFGQAATEAVLQIPWPPSGRAEISINSGSSITIRIPLSVGNTGNTRPTGNRALEAPESQKPQEQQQHQEQLKKEQQKKQQQPKQQHKKVRTAPPPPPPPPVALVAAALGASVAAVQVQYYLHLCTKKSQNLVPVQARFQPPCRGLADQGQGNEPQDRGEGCKNCLLPFPHGPFSWV